jgi:hypothetical protein
MQVARELPLLLVSKRQSIADLPTLEGALKLLAIPLEPEPEGETEPEPPVSQIPEPVPQPPAQPVPILDVQVQPASRAPVPQPPAAKDRTHRPQSQNGQPVNRAKWKELEELLGKTLNRTDLLNHADPHAILHRRMIDGIKQAMRDLADWNAARWTTAGPDAPADATPEDTMKRVNSDIEAFCRRIMAIAESEMPTDEWIKYNGRGETAMQKIKDACSTLRSCKCSAQCPKCNGEGCTRCLDTGRVTHYMLEQMT